MPKPPAARAPCWPPPDRRRPQLGSLLALALIPLATAALGGAFLWAHYRSGPQPLQAASGVVLWFAAACQARIAWAVTRASLAGRSTRLWSRMVFWRALLPGVAGAYAVALLLGPQRGAPFAFTTLSLLWLTGLVLVLTARPGAFGSAERWLQARASRRVGLAAYYLVAGLAGGEAMLQVASRVSGDAGVSHASLVPVGPTQGAAVPAENGAARHRIALVGDDAAPALARRAGAHLDATKSSEVRCFWRGGAGPRQYADELLDEALRWRADQVLICVAVGNDFWPEPPRSEWFDWRSLQLARWTVGQQPCASQADRPPDYLTDCGRRLSVCRTPLDQRARRQWNRVLGHLERAAARCRAQGTAVSLVLVPGEFQVNRPLYETLQRRMGYRPGELDLAFPQRRLISFAAERKLPVVDLLPALCGTTEPVFERQTDSLNAAGSLLAAQTLGVWLQGPLAAPLSSTAQVSKAAP